MRIALDFLLLVVAVWASVAVVREFDAVSATITDALVPIQRAVP